MLAIDTKKANKKWWRSCTYNKSCEMYLWKKKTGLPMRYDSSRWILILWIGGWEAVVEMPLGKAAAVHRPSSGSSRWREVLGLSGKGYKCITVPPSCCNQKRFDLTNVAGWSSNTECWHSEPKMMGWCQAVMTLMRSQLYEFSTWKARWNVSIIRWIYFTCLSRKEPIETYDTFGAPKSDFLTTAGSAW